MNSQIDNQIEMEMELEVPLQKGKQVRKSKKNEIPDPSVIEEGEVVDAPAPKVRKPRARKAPVNEAVVITQQDPQDTPESEEVQEEIADAISSPLQVEWTLPIQPDASFPAFLASRQIASPVVLPEDEEDEEEMLARRLQEIRKRKEQQKRATERDATYERDRSIRREAITSQIEALQRELDCFDRLSKEQFWEYEDSLKPVKEAKEVKKAPKKATKKVVEEGDKKQRGATVPRRSLNEVLRNGDKLILTMDRALTAEWVDGKMISNGQEFQTLNQMLRFHTLTCLGKNSCGSGWTSYRLQRAGTTELLMLDPLFVVSQSRNGSDEEEEDA
jgi:hypothetical protein